MSKRILLQRLSDLSREEFVALNDQADKDYAEGRICIDENGWIVSETEMRLRRSLASRPDREYGSRKAPRR
jgi:hypothetical protein